MYLQESDRSLINFLCVTRNSFLNILEIRVPDHGLLRPKPVGQSDIK